MRRHRPFLSALLRRLVLIGYTVDVYVYLFVVLFFFLLLLIVVKGRVHFILFVELWFTSQAFHLLHLQL